ALAGVAGRMQGARARAYLLPHQDGDWVIALRAIGPLEETFGRRAPYVLALGLIVAWHDATKLSGLPTPGRVAAWLERGDTAESRALLKGFSMGGNAVAVLLALAGAVLYALGMGRIGILVEVAAIVLLLAGTYAASTVRSALPVELEEDPAEARQQLANLKLMAIGPIIVSVLAGLLTGLAFFGVLTNAPTLASLADAARPALGGLVAVLAGLNLARARLRSHGEPGPLRQALVSVTASALAGAGFFSIMVHARIMTGPIVEAGIGLLFDYTTLLAASLFVASRGLYPMPWSDLKKTPKSQKTTPEDYKEKLQRSMYVAYIVSGGFVLLVVGGLMAIGLGVVDAPLPDTAVGRNVAFLSMVAFGLLLLVGLAALYFQSRRLKTPHKEKVEFKKRYSPHEVARLATLAISITVASVLALLGILVFAGQLESLGSLTLERKHSTDFFVFAILIGMGPAGFLYNRERKRISAIDAMLPEFLRDLAESQRTGMTLTQAVITASKGNYGAMTPEVRKMAAQIEWGVSFEQALTSFAQRVETPLVKRTTSLIIEAQSSGGNVIDVLTAASDDAREIQMIHAERKGGMQIYVMIIYIAFLVFLGVIAILNVKFMPEVANAVAGASGVTVGSITFAEFDIQAFRTLFFHAAVIQGLGGGFVAGAMEEGKPVAGLKHAFAMVIIAYVAFRFLLGG
ncbi:MAG: type II secretion system F family protein, partial [Candidatus Thermoplasmatota archaeon]|nr:type II secretion system F family protein [Candidatus Thermoplasmatota archaeon]